MRSKAWEEIVGSGEKDSEISAAIRRELSGETPGQKTPYSERTRVARWASLALVGYANKSLEETAYLLRELEQDGYLHTDDYTKMDGNQIMTYFKRTVVPDIGVRLCLHCPELVQTILRKNASLAKPTNLR